MITAEELENYLGKGEGIRIEFKEASNNFPQSAYETLVSFSNKEGGVIILGVDDDKNIKGINVTQVQQIRDDVFSTCKNTNLIYPSIFPSVSEINYKGRQLLIIKVPVSSQVHKLKGVVYDREGGIDMEIKDQTKIEEIYFRKRQVFTENQIYKYLSIEDLDLSLFDKARRIINTSKPSHPWLELSNEELLRSASLLVKDFTTGESGLTLAAGLIFGKDITIHNLLPSYKVEAMVRIEDLDRWDDRLTLRTNLIDTYLQLMEFILKQKSLPNKFYIENDQRIDLKNIIFREVIGNVIVHREYTNTLATELLIYSNKVIATNPNKAYYRGPLDVNTFSPYAKNPNIRKFFTAFGWTDEIGSGIRNVTKYLKIYTPGASPRFIEDDVFKTEIPIEIKTFSILIPELIELIATSSKQFLQMIEQDLKLLPINERLIVSSKADSLKNIVSIWHSNGSSLESLNWPKNPYTVSNNLFGEEIELGLHKKISVFLQVLFLSLSAKRMDVLMGVIKYESRSSFRDLYIKPLLEAGLIIRTIPDKPNSPNQQYLVSEKGRLFLSGYEI